MVVDFGVNDELFELERFVTADHRVDLLCEVVDR